MGRKRRRIIKRAPKPLPKIFTCPVCSAFAVTVTHEPGSDKALVQCGSCKKSLEVPWYPAYSEVDAYSKWYDLVVKGEASVEAGKG
ncbi:hypothetical protein HRbin01_00874 [archaeon HR01]|nr:hypothetical protein HRbin01_00874 [archaeon HR01]